MRTCPQPAVPRPPNQRRVLHEQELAERWGLSVKTLQRWRCMALGPRFMKLGARVAYRLEDVEQYEEDVLQCSTQGTAYL